jgi:hypothetical protein
MYAFFWHCIDNYDPKFNELADLKLLPVSESKKAMISQSLDSATIFLKACVNAEWMHKSELLKPKEIYDMYAKYTKLYVTHPTFTIFRQIFLKELKISNIGSASELNMQQFESIFANTTAKSNVYIQNLIKKINELLKTMENINQPDEYSLWKRYLSQLENSMQAWNNNLVKFMVALWEKQYTKNITDDIQELIESNIGLLR